MIRLTTLDTYESELLDKLTRTMFQTYGLGCEYVGEVAYPASTMTQKTVDPAELLAHVDRITSYGDDKVVYLTRRPLASRTVPGGEVPTLGLSDVAGGRALVSSHGLLDTDPLFRKLTRQLLHELGHLWSLHHCLDPRCAMYPPWALAPSSDAALCVFCRDKSEARVRLAKT